MSEITSKKRDELTHIIMIDGQAVAHAIKLSEGWTLADPDSGRGRLQIVTFSSAEDVISQFGRMREKS